MTTQSDSRGTLEKYPSSQFASGSMRCLVCGGLLWEEENGLFDTRFGIEGQYEVRRCLDCQLEQLVPRPELGQLKSLYESYYNFNGEANTLYTRLRERFLLSPLYRIWARADGDISFHLRAGAARLLDVGCNEGRGLKIYARNGFTVEGLELNENAASVARRSGFRVYTDLLEDFVPKSPYDVVVLSNVLEHSLDPTQMLDNVSRILAERGQVWISCPNNESWLRGAFGLFWINWHVPFHISHFNRASLRRLLESKGFVDIEISNITPSLWVAQSIIARCFSKEGKKTSQLRNPFLVLFLMAFVRLALFPVLWIGNKSGQGDCLLAVATKT